MLNHAGFLGGIVTAALVVLTPTTYAAEFMFRARVDGRMLEGQPLAWSDTQMLLLGRDGALHEFNPKKAKEARKTSPRFFSYTASEMRNELQREFGDRFDISSTTHYLVVHPRGERDVWAQRFEDLFRSFNHYFRLRGFTPEEPKFPLVAVVFRNQADYFAHARKGGQPMKPGTLGHYEPGTNRVYLFDSTGGSDDADWSLNAETIIHEATHQSAYNVGIHNRFAVCPRWLVEGLATMFEARGVWDSRSYQTQTDRVNRERLRDFQAYAKRRPEGSMASLIAADDLFEADTLAAYAEAWALSFYLCETRPQLYAKYLELTGSRANFGEYPAAERLADFKAVFGQDVRLLENQFLQYMKDVR
ncbi:MAG: DUF1570 domain-containing protein [Pirellulales bacterium]